MRVGSTLVLSNTLQSLRRHPVTGDRLDDTVIGSLLLWGENWDRSTTVFAEVKSLAAGHALEWSEERPTMRTRQYWSVPVEGAPVAYSDRRDYVDGKTLICRCITQLVDLRDISDWWLRVALAVRLIGN
jgi:hypothetical protein